MRLDGKYYQAPYPHATGVVNFPAKDVARTLGAPGEVDAAGAVRRVSVVPAPFQQPHPPVFTAVSGSMDSIEFCAERCIAPVYFSSMSGIVDMANHYVAHGRTHGYDYRLGERQCLVRWPHFTANDQHTRQVLTAQDEEFYRNIYGSFFPPLVAGATDMIQRIIDTGLFPCGTVDDQIAYWRSALAQVPCEYICLIWHYAQAPKQSVIDEIETFMTKVLPALEVPDFPASARRVPAAAAG